MIDVGQRGYEREQQFNIGRNAIRGDLHGRRKRTESRPGRLRRGIFASQEARLSQRRLSFDHQQPDGNLRNPANLVIVAPARLRSLHEI